MFTYAVPPTPNSSLSGLASLALDSNLCACEGQKMFWECNWEIMLAF